MLHALIYLKKEKRWKKGKKVKKKDSKDVQPTHCYDSESSCYCMTVWSRGGSSRSLQTKYSECITARGRLVRRAHAKADKQGFQPLVVRKSESEL